MKLRDFAVDCTLSFEEQVAVISRLAAELEFVDLDRRLDVQEIDETHRKYRVGYYRHSGSDDLLYQLNVLVRLSKSTILIEVLRETMEDYERVFYARMNYSTGSCMLTV